MKNNIILILFILFCLAVSYLLACAYGWLVSFIIVNAFGISWPNVWLVGLLIWLVVGTIIGIKNYLKK